MSAPGSIYDIDAARRLAVSTKDISKLARRLEAACDEIEVLRLALAKAQNYAESSAHIARAALAAATTPNPQDDA
jgi:hypothetical protein